MRNALLVLALSTAAACTGTWEKHSTFERRASLTALVVSDVAIACDLSQTLWFADGGKYDHGLTEMNPVLGRTPSPERIIATNIAALVGNTALYFVLPKKLRPYWFGGVMLVEGANVLTQPNPQDARYGQHRGCDIQQNLNSTNPVMTTARTR
jgi:hypothetical protein